MNGCSFMVFIKTMMDLYKNFVKINVYVLVNSNVACISHAI